MGRLPSSKKEKFKKLSKNINLLIFTKIKCPKCNRILGGKATTKKKWKALFLITIVTIVK